MARINENYQKLQAGYLFPEIERRVRMLPGVTETFSKIGGGAEERVNVASILVQFVDKSRREASQAELMVRARELLADRVLVDLQVHDDPLVRRNMRLNL